MSANNTKKSIDNKSNLFTPSFNIVGTLGTVGGFIGDVLTPLGDIVGGVLIVSLTSIAVGLLGSVIKKQKKDLFKKVAINSSLFSAIIAVFFFMNQGTQNGFLGDNVEPISEFQQSLNIISDQLTEIDSKIDEGFDDVSDQITTSTNEVRSDLADIKDIVTGDAELKNMSSTDDLTATKELNERTTDQGAQRVAILYFDNTGQNPSMDQLKKGLADMLITDLSNVRMLDIVERDRLESLFEEQELSNTDEFDPETAARLGKLLGADIILTGGYFDLFGNIRIDARFIDVETGQVLKSDGVDGQTTNFFKLQKQLSWKIINNMDAKITQEEIESLEEQENSKNLSLDDINLYSEALSYFDEGNLDQSRQIIESLLETYPDFEPALRLLEKLNN